MLNRLTVVLVFYCIIGTCAQAAEADIKEDAEDVRFAILFKKAKSGNTEVRRLFGGIYSDNHEPQYMHKLSHIAPDWIDVEPWVLENRKRKEVWDTALMIAAETGNREVMPVLFNLGIDINELDKDGLTPLMRTTIMGHKTAVQTLLDVGANVDHKNEKQKTALMYAVVRAISSRGNEIEIVQMLLGAGAKVDEKDEDGDAPLMLIAKNTDLTNNKHKQFVKALLNAGATVDVRDNLERTPLMYAAHIAYTQYNHDGLARKYEFVTDLLEAGADANALDIHEKTVLDYIWEGKTEYRGRIIPLLEKVGGKRSKQLAEQKTQQLLNAAQLATKLKFELAEQQELQKMQFIKKTLLRSVILLCSMAIASSILKSSAKKSCCA